MKSTTTPIYVMLVDSDDYPNTSAVPAETTLDQELIESAKEPSIKSDIVYKKEIDVGDSKKVFIIKR